MRVIIACAGPQTKWKNHLGVPSHLVPVDGEPLLHRTIRQARAVCRDVHVTAPDDDRYTVLGVSRHVRGPEHDNEYVSTRGLWNDTGRTVLLLGDVYFTDVAIARIVYRPEREYRVFGRRGGSSVTGTPWGEIFAASWWPEQHALLDEHLSRIAGMDKAGWRLLRSVQGTDLDRHVTRRPWFVKIDDATDDIDFPADYERHPATGEAVRG
ncbi:hypothetical protein AB0K34_11005 [Actinomadura sp. NPDC049382]|uniref:hypothetical protein n=1 Tax=Actinomadura sp. NPDC049382 TaxID=3158220 RepID=UPI003415529A